MTFDPFNDFETRGYLHNRLGEKDPAIVKYLEHRSFTRKIDAAFEYLSSVEHLSYEDVLHTHKILFGDVYPWAGEDRARTAPDLAVNKGGVMFSHPADSGAAVDYALKLGSDKSRMAQRPGEIMGYLAYGHPFLDGNGRTIMVIHAELAERAGISIAWDKTDKAAYLTALTQEIDDPGAGRLDAYLKPYIRKAVGADFRAENVARTRGLGQPEDGRKKQKGLKKTQYTSG